MTALVGIAAEPGAVPAAHRAFKLMNVCCLRPAHDVQRDGLLCVAAEAEHEKPYPLPRHEQAENLAPTRETSPQRIPRASSDCRRWPRNGTQRQLFEKGGEWLTPVTKRQGQFTRTTTTAFLNALIQYNSDTHQWTSNVRFNIIHRPLSDIFCGV